MATFMVLSIINEVVDLLSCANDLMCLSLGALFNFALCNAVLVSSR